MKHFISNILHSKGNLVIRKFVRSRAVRLFVLFCIILNSIQLGVESSFSPAFGQWLEIFFQTVFCIEIILKIIGYGKVFFRSGWDVLDFIIVALSLIPGRGIFSILRMFRIFRSWRLLWRIKKLRELTVAMLKSLSNIVWVCFILSLMFYAASVLTTNLYGAVFPEWFGNIGRSMYTLFQIATLEGWSDGIVRPVMKEFPYAWIVFVTFIMIVSYTVLNLIVAVLCEAIMDMRKTESKNRRPDKYKRLLLEISLLRKEMEKLQNSRTGNGK